MLHRKSAFLAASSLCAAAALPSWAGRELDADAPLPLRQTIAAVDPNAALAAAGPVLTANDAALLAAAPAPAAAAERPTPSQSVTINLINRLVARGLLPKEDADELIKQAEADASEARAQVAVAQDAAVQAAVAQAVLAVQSSPPQDYTPGGDSVSVTYIPEVVKAQLRDEIRKDVMAQAREQNWAAPRTFPDWVSRIKLFGDIRVRSQGDYFSAVNDNTGSFPSFNAINTGAPFDVSGTVFSPQLNVDQDRQRYRMRARVGLRADLGDGFTAGLRIATGDSNSPTSTNQTLGGTGGVAGSQGGNFSKYAIWLDRGFLKYELGGQPEKNIGVTIGRFDNPFFATEIMWDDDLGFDGGVLQAKYGIFKGFTAFLAGGAFPVFNTDFNFASNQPAKFDSDDKWLLGGQIGADWKVLKTVNLKFGAAYYDFQDIEGKLSDPFVPLTTADAGNTDGSRPAFAQKGNTYRPIRNIVPTADNDFGTSRQFQYFGLATPFRNLALTARLDVNYFEPVQISIVGEYIKNLAFDRDAINLVAVNNRGPNNALGGVGTYAGGDTAWIAGVKVGKPVFEKRWDWSLGLNYRHVESDAVVDGFVDSDFGGGGTNVEGYTVSGALALSPNVALGIRWMSSNEIAGPPLKIDTLQIDVNGKF